MMQLDGIQAFVAVARAGGFAAAGRQLHVPRSTLSRQIQRLEAELGVRLMDRTTRSVRLTEAGASYYQRCAHALELLDGASQNAREAGARARGTLRITVPLDIARELIAPLLPELRRRYPDLELAFEVTQRSVDLVAEGFDLALRSGERLKDSSLVAKKLAQFTFRLYASPAYLAARGTPVDGDDLARHDLVAFAVDDEPLPWRLHGPDGAIELAPRAWIRSNELGLPAAAIAAGLGIGLLETITAARDLRAGRLVLVMPEYTMHGGLLYAVYPSSRRVPAKLRVFVELLVEHLRRIGV